MLNPIIVAEMSINHLGMVNILKEMIISAKESGADYIKLKIKNIDNYYDKNNKWRNFEFNKYRKSLELSKDDFFIINDFCKDNNIKWFSTIHDIEGLNFIKQFDVPFYKIASMDSKNLGLVNNVISICKEQNKPLVMSLGGKSDKDTDILINKITKNNIFCYLLHTVSIYPTPTSKSNIPYIIRLKNKYENDKIKIGYSGHEEGYGATILSSIIGVSMIERHFSLSRDINIHHIKSSLLPNEFRDMVNLIKNIKKESLDKKIDFLIEELNFIDNKHYE